MNVNRWKEVAPHYTRLTKRTAFDLNIPCIVIDQDGDLFETCLSGLASHMKVSAALSSPQMQRYMQLSVELGAEDAMNKMLAPMDDEAETFCELWSEGRKDIEKGTKGTVDDVVRAISIAKEGFNGYPRKILVVQMAETRASLLLVSPQGTHPLEG